MRCPRCKGLRVLAFRNRNSQAICSDCRKGKVVKRSRYENFWLERFTMEEIRELGKQIWG